MLRLKWHESWLHDSFLSLDPELIEKNHGTAQKNMHRCVRAFEKLENEGCTQIAAAIKQQVGVCAPCVRAWRALMACTDGRALMACARWVGMCGWGALSLCGTRVHGALVVLIRLGWVCVSVHARGVSCGF